MDAERNKRKGPQPREGKAKQMEGLDLESVIERARGHDVDAVRRQRRARQVIVEVEDGATVVEAASAEPSPLGAVMGKEERAQVRGAIARLPENYRLPLVLRYYSELSYDEIAQQLDLRRNYVAALRSEEHTSELQSR